MLASASPRYSQTNWTLCVGEITEPKPKQESSRGPEDSQRMGMAPSHVPNTSQALAGSCIESHQWYVTRGDHAGMENGRPEQQGAGGGGAAPGLRVQTPEVDRPEF